MKIVETSETKPISDPSRRTPVLPPDDPKRNLWWLWLLILAALLYGGYRFYEWQLQQQAQRAAAQDALAARKLASVVVAKTHLGDMPISLRGLGSVTAFQTVTVKPRVDGQLMRVDFAEGQIVKQGQVLAELDPRPFQVQVAQAEGQLARDTALLRDANTKLQRGKELFAEQLLARQELDTAGSLVAQYEGAIAADKAQLASARLQLTYANITAPLTGRIGLRQVDAGNVVHAADTTGIAVITQLQPVAVLFSIPEDYLPRVLSRLREQAALPVQAYDRTGAERLATGRLLTVDNQIDPTTGTSKLKAVFPNTDNSLFPNQFVNVELELGTEHDAIIMPAAAMQRGPKGNFVYVIENSTASLREVTPGTIVGDNISITKGLKAGEMVVVDGADKLTEGLKVEVHTAPTIVRQGSKS